MSNVRGLCGAQRQLSGVDEGSPKELDLADTILHADTIRAIALELEMKEPFRKNYKTKEVISALYKEVCDMCE